MADIGAAYVALLLVLATLGSSISLRPLAVLVAPIVVLFAKVLGLYDRDQHLLAKGTIDELPKILYLAVLFVLTTWLLEAILLHGWLTRPEVFALLLATFLLAAVFRAVVRKVAVVGSEPERCIVLGNGPEALHISKKLQDATSTNAVVIGRVTPLPQTPYELGVGVGVPVLGGLESLRTTATDWAIERVIIAPSGGSPDETLDMIRLVKTLGLKVSVLPRLMEVIGSSSSFDDVHGTLFLGLRPYGLSQSSALIKRATDLLVAGALLTLLSPLFLILAVAVKLDSGGSILFRQRRIGRRGEIFEMLKFRSMVTEAEEIKERLVHLNEAEGGLFKIAADPRITRLGRFMRRTSLDELPQLINVLRGEMSLVGPRPLVPNEDAMIDGWKRRRLVVKPGMTGLWQIFGSSRIPMPEMVKIDYHYGANWSLWLDMKILLRTVPYVLRRSGI